MKIIFSGGGTLGPVTPLLAIQEVIAEAHPQVQCMWVGTDRGPERMLVEQKGIKFHTIVHGKFRRYLSLRNLIDVPKVIIGFFQSLGFLWREHPDVCISAGGFVSVPLHIAAWLLGIPTWIHQQDVSVGLANKLMTPFATHISTALKQSVSMFPKKKSSWLGNPIRKEVFRGTKKDARVLFNLTLSLPVVFITGGGTGSMRVNQLITQALTHLEGLCQIIHLTGRERPQELIEPAARQFSFYHPYIFFAEQMADAYAIADIVISRGGFGTITEMAALKKASILVPKPGHQVENVIFLENADAVVLLPEQTSDGNHMAKVIKELLADKKGRQEMAERLHELLPPADDKKVLALFDVLVK